MTKKCTICAEVDKLAGRFITIQSKTSKTVFTFGIFSNNSPFKIKILPGKFYM